MHLLFAPYFQSRVWRKISEKLREGHARLERGYVVEQRVIFEPWQACVGAFK